MKTLLLLLLLTTTIVTAEPTTIEDSCNVHAEPALCGTILTGPTVNVPHGWKLIGVADFNRDNYPDLVLWNEHTGQTVIWILHPQP